MLSLGFGSCDSTTRPVPRRLTDAARLPAHRGGACGRTDRIGDGTRTVREHVAPDPTTGSQALGFDARCPGQVRAARFFFLDMLDAVLISNECHSGWFGGGCRPEREHT